MIEAFELPVAVFLSKSSGLLCKNQEKSSFECVERFLKAWAFF